ncbi:hypothetical protein [Streptomyces sp. NPDC056982]|uniref:hypothetical protein n=1 Tax=Streptomyces sp. NPDC056982 TaxID=3345986 RepID=UPI00362C7C4C
MRQPELAARRPASAARDWPGQSASRSPSARLPAAATPDTRTAVLTAFAPHTTVRGGRITRYHLDEVNYAAARPYFDD